MVLRFETPLDDDRFQPGEVREGKTVADADAAETETRQSLRRDLIQRRQSLSVREYNFLDGLVANGDATRWHIAKRALDDKNLFFDDDDVDTKRGREETPVAGIGIGGDAAEEQGLGGSSQQATAASRRRETIKLRRQSVVHASMWKAHEKGVSPLGSWSSSQRSSVAMQRPTAGGGNPSFAPLSTKGSANDGLASIQNMSNNMSAQAAAALVREEFEHLVNDSDGDDSCDDDDKCIDARPPNYTFRQDQVIEERPNEMQNEQGQHHQATSFKQEETINQAPSAFTSCDLLSSEERGRLPPPSGARNSDNISPPSFPSSRTPSVVRWDTTMRHHSDPFRGGGAPPLFKKNAASNASTSPRSSSGSLRHGSILRRRSQLQLFKQHIASNKQLVHKMSASDAAALVRKEFQSMSFDSIRNTESGVTSDFRSSYRPTGSIVEHRDSESTGQEGGPAVISPSTDAKHLDATDTSGSARTPAPLRPSRSIGRRQTTRKASVNVYGGEGFEIMMYMHLPSDSIISARDSRTTSARSSIIRRFSIARRMSSTPGSMVSVKTGSFDDLSPVGDSATDQCAIQSSLSQDAGEELIKFDAWQVLNDEDAVDYGYGAGDLPFQILGTSADDASAQPHVLSPPLMESLQCFLPYSVMESNFWLKFSLVRDGSSLISLLREVRGSKHTILALETVDGEVFGCFTGSPWRKTWGFYGTGESFLWRMRGSRASPCRSMIDQAQLESELEVFPWTGANDMVQCCNSDKISIGGGVLDGDERGSGFGLIIDADLLRGRSSSCATFGNPCLSRIGGGTFDIVNLEVWTLTPCFSVKEAENMEMSLLFLEELSK